MIQVFKILVYPPGKMKVVAVRNRQMSGTCNNLIKVFLGHEGYRNGEP